METLNQAASVVAMAQTIPHLAYSIPELLAVIRLGRTRVYELINSGALPARRVGRRTLVLHEDLQVFLRSLPVIGK